MVKLWTTDNRRADTASERWSVSIAVHFDRAAPDAGGPIHTQPRVRVCQYKDVHRAQV